MSRYYRPKRSLQGDLLRFAQVWTVASVFMLATTESMRFLLTVIFLVVAPAIINAQSCPSTLSVGFRIVQIAGLKAAVWYPSTAAQSSYEYGVRGEITGLVAANAAPATCERFPLIVFSHGIGGCGTQSIFITEELARRGYIVVAPDHRDAICAVDGPSRRVFNSNPQESFRDPQSWTDQTYVDRKEDIRRLIDAMLTDPVFSPVINTDRIGAAGHSLGGYTIMGMAGGWASWKDSRIKAGVLFSPFADPFLVAGRTPKLDIPLMYQGGTVDLFVTPSLEQPGGAYDRSGVPKFYAKFTGGHFVWTNNTCSGGTVANCTAGGVAQSINSDAFDFLDHYLKAADRPTLWSATRTTVRTDYRRNVSASSVSAASYAPIALSPMSVGSLFSEGLADKTYVATTLPLPTTLAGLTVSVRDQPTRIYFVSPNQINFLVPEGLTPGAAPVTVRSGNDVIASGTLTVGAVAPALFSANREGRGAPAGEYILVAPNGTRATGVLFDAALSALPLNPASGQLYLVLYGTGLRNGSPARTTARVGNQAVPILSIAASPEYPGLDQIAIGPVPPSLAGAGLVEVEVSLDGQPANRLSVLFR